MFRYCCVLCFVLRAMFVVFNNMTMMVVMVVINGGSSAQGL